MFMNAIYNNQQEVDYGDDDHYIGVNDGGDDNDDDFKIFVLFTLRFQSFFKTRDLLYSLVVETKKEEDYLL